MAQRTAVDLNCDLGEDFGPYRVGYDREIMPMITSANAACGFHAGDPHVLRATVDLAVENGVMIGAHPGLPDRTAFGRRAWAVSPDELEDMCVYQMGALKAFVEARGRKLQHVIQHGALTVMMESDPALGRAFLRAVLAVDPDMIYLALPGSYLPDAAADMGLATARAVLVDRAYDSRLRLAPRKMPGAVIHDLNEIADRVERMLTDGRVRTIDGDLVDIPFESMMLHGDSPGALEMARKVVAVIRRLGLETRPLSELI